VRSVNLLLFPVATMSAVLFSSCQAAARSSESRAVAEDSALFVATVRVLRDSEGPATRVVPEPLLDGKLIPIGREKEKAIRDWRERWLRSAGFLSQSNYESCTAINAPDGGKEGCPKTSLTVAQVSPASGWGERQSVDVSVRLLGPTGSSEARSRYVFARRGREWTLVGIERGVIE
jgi:hypothetical protein